MRYVKLVLVVAVGVFGCVFATSASAQEEPVTFVNEPSGEPCSPCEIHFVGESHVRALPSNVMVSRCQDEFVGEIYADGTGEVTYSGSDDGNPECSVHQCLVDGAEANASIDDAAEVADGTSRFFIRFCIGGAAAEVHCDLEVELDQAAPHSYALSTASLCDGGTRRLEGSWETEGTTFEVVHEEEPSLEVLNEENPGSECSTAVGDCEVMVEGESHLIALPSGITVFRCSDQLRIMWNHDGTAYAHWTGVTEGAGPCNLSNCTVMSDEWPISGTTETAPGTVTSTLTICLDFGGFEAECSVPINITTGAAPHQYSVSSVAPCAGGSRRYELLGEVDIDADGFYPIEFSH